MSVALVLLGTCAALLAPWPLQFLIDNVLQNQPLPVMLAAWLGPLVGKRYGLLVLAVTGGVLIKLVQHGLTVLDNYVNTAWIDKQIGDGSRGLWRTISKSVRLEADGDRLAPHTGRQFTWDQVYWNGFKHQELNQGGFIPGIRAGRPTAEYLDYVLTRVTLPGSLYLGLIALLPLIAFAVVGADQNFPFGGASILIIVGVGLETVKQIDSQLQQRHYEGLLR